MLHSMKAQVRNFSHDYEIMMIITKRPCEFHMLCITCDFRYQSLSCQGCSGNLHKCFVHPILVFGFWSLLATNTKILRNLCLHFARQDGKKTDRKSLNLSDQNTKNQKTKIWDERNNSVLMI